MVIGNSIFAKIRFEISLVKTHTRNERKYSEIKKSHLPFFIWSNINQVSRFQIDNI